MPHTCKRTKANRNQETLGESSKIGYVSSAKSHLPPKRKYFSISKMSMDGLGIESLGSRVKANIKAILNIKEVETSFKTRRRME